MPAPPAPNEMEMTPWTIPLTEREHALLALARFQCCSNLEGLPEDKPIFTFMAPPDWIKRALAQGVAEEPCPICAKDHKYMNHDFAAQLTRPKPPAPVPPPSREEAGRPETLDSSWLGKGNDPGWAEPAERERLYALAQERQVLALKGEVAEATERADDWPNRFNRLHDLWEHANSAYEREKEKRSAAESALAKCREELEYRKKAEASIGNELLKAGQEAATLRDQLSTALSAHTSLAARLEKAEKELERAKSMPAYMVDARWKVLADEWKEHARAARAELEESQQVVEDLKEKLRDARDSDALTSAHAEIAALKAKVDELEQPGRGCSQCQQERNSERARAAAAEAELAAALARVNALEEAAESWLRNSLLTAVERNPQSLIDAGWVPRAILESTDDAWLDGAVSHWLSARAGKGER